MNDVRASDKIIPPFLYGESKSVVLVVSLEKKIVKHTFIRKPLNFLSDASRFCVEFDA